VRLFPRLWGSCGQVWQLGPGRAITPVPTLLLNRKT
jgi:hypothetical protein